MRAHRLRVASCVPALLLGCIAPTNPYDPDAPREVQARARVHGVVTLGDAPASATLTLSSGDLTSTAQTDDEGRYGLELSPGTYAMVVSAEGALDASRSVVLAPGGEQAIDFVLAPSPTLDTTPPALDPDAPPIAIVKSAEGFVSSVAMTVALRAEGASEVALDVTVNGVRSEPTFQAYTTAATVLLPAQDCVEPDCIVVCATFRDAAGNTLVIDAEDCDSARLDLTPPAAPVLVEDDTVVSEQAFTFHLVEADDPFALRYEVLVDPAAPAFTDAVATDAGDGTLAIAVPLAAATPDPDKPWRSAETNLVRVRAVDAAGNVSPESVRRVVVDREAPPAPRLADPPRAFDDGPFVTDADTLSVNFLGDNEADDDATFSHYVIETSLLPDPVETALRDGIVVQLLPERANTVRVTAVDQAGNQSAPSEVSVRHDSLPPSTPVLGPLYAEARKGPVQVGFLFPQLGSFDSYLDEDDVEVREEVRVYELKDGKGTGYKRVDAGEALFAELRVARDNEICVRGVDDAGNVSNDDCVIVAETSDRDVTANIDQAHAFDAFGDFFFFVNPDGVWMRDLRTDEDRLLAPGNGSGSTFASQGSRALHASGDPRRIVLTYESAARMSIVHVELTPGACEQSGALCELESQCAPADTCVLRDEPVVRAGQLEGSRPYVRRDELVYVRAGRLRYLPTVDVPGMTSDTSGAFVIPPDAYDNEVDLADASTLCPDTSPRVESGVVVWCATNGSGGEIRAVRVVDGGAAAMVLSTEPVARVRAGTLLGSSEPHQQPQIADGLIAWIEEDGGARAVYQPFSPGAPVTATGQVRTSLFVDDLRDLQRGNVVSVQRHSTITSDIGVANLFVGVMQLITDDTTPQDQPVIDDQRIFFSDTSRGDLVRMFDVSTLRWAVASADIAFQPVTSEDVTLWIGGVGDEVRLLGRALPIDEPSHTIFVVDEGGAGSVAFFGPAKADPTFAVGGTRMAYLVGADADGPFSLRLRELGADGLPGPVRVIANNASAAFALDPDGDTLVFVNMLGEVRRVDLPETLPTNLSSTVVPLAGAGFVRMIDIDDDMIVAQRGGDASQQDEASGQGQLVCASQGLSAVLAPSGIRGPKVAHLGDGSFLVAASGGDGINAGYCFLDCGAVPSCPFGDASTARGHDTFVQVTRDGRIAYLSNALGLTQVVLFDVFARRWSFVSLGDTERTGLNAATRRLVWADASLGAYGVFELTLP